jgi:hypothetical protein
MIQIRSYSQINGLGFGVTEAEALINFGVPITSRKTPKGTRELVFRDFILRFEASSGALMECTILPGCDASINGTPVAWDSGFLRWLGEQDPDLKEVVGFIVSLKLGISATGFHDGDESQKAIHAFKRDSWNRFIVRMRPFRPSENP